MAKPGDAFYYKSIRDGKENSSLERLRNVSAVSKAPSKKVQFLLRETA